MAFPITDIFGSAFLNSVGSLIERLKLDPALKAQLQTALKEQGNDIIKTQMQDDLAAMQAVNLTMQTEVQSKGWFARDWRAMWGYLSGITFFIEVGAVVYSFLFAPATAPQVTQVVTVLTPMWGVPLTVLGLNAWHSGQCDIINAKNGNGK